MIRSTNPGSTLTLTGELPRGYESRRMWLYVARTRSKWGLWLSDGNGYSVRALVDNMAPSGAGRVSMAEWFSTRHAATRWAEGHGWYAWPGKGWRSVPRKCEAACRENQGVTNFIVEAR